MCHNAPIQHNIIIVRQCQQDTAAVYITALTGGLKVQIRVNRLKTALQRKIKFGKSVLKASHSWKSNNMIEKQIPCINNTITTK